MIHDLIFRSLVIACACFPLSNSNAMEADTQRESPQIIYQNQWDIIEFERKRAYGHDFSKFIKLSPKDRYSLFFYIAVGQMLSGDFYIELYFNPSHTGHYTKADLLHKELTFNNIPFDTFSYTEFDTFSSSECKALYKEEKHLTKFLSTLYTQHHIPDFILDRIVKHIALTDFRINILSMIACINKQMPEEPTNEDFRRITMYELAKIPNEAQRVELGWEIAQEMMSSFIQTSDSIDLPHTPRTTIFDRQFVIDLCAQITDKNLPFFGEAKRMSAELVFSQDSPEKLPITDRYKQPLLSLLEGSNTTTDKAPLNSFVKAFVNNGAPTSYLPEELNDLIDLTFSTESMFDLLNIIRLQQRELNELRRKK